MESSTAGDFLFPVTKMSSLEPWWMRSAPRRSLLLFLLAIPLLTPIISPANDAPFIYAYDTGIFLLSAWFSWKAAHRYPLEKIRWQTIVVAQCIHALGYAVAAQRSMEWINTIKGDWLQNACVSVCWVLYLPAMMGVRSVRDKGVRTLDYLLAVVTSGLLMRALGSGIDPGNGLSGTMVIQSVVVTVTLSALLARFTSTRPGIKLFSSVMSLYLGLNLLVYFLLNIVNQYWLRTPNILFSDLLSPLAELVLCELSVSLHRTPLMSGPELEPVLVDSLQPSILAIGGVLLALYGFRARPVIAAVAVVYLVLCYVLRTQLFYRRQFLREKQLREQASQMQELAMRDTLTGVGNRRWFDEEAAKLLAAEASYPCSLMLVDTDFFKEVNDTFGHPVGDEVLRVVASIVAEVTAKVKRGCCARIGGDEFGAIWPRTSSEEAILLAESTRSRLAQREFPDARRVTVSIGVVAARDPISLLELIRRADAALYRAKIAGRNEVQGD